MVMMKLAQDMVEVRWHELINAGRHKSRMDALAGDGGETGKITHLRVSRDKFGFGLI
jgi:hypothetical protein